jgi:succinyl-CoA synthetase alpha subunit
VAETVLEQFSVLVAPAKGESGVKSYRTLASALEAAADVNLVQISVAGEFAAAQAQRALAAGRHVMLFSDNVELEDEVALKLLGREKGLLVMGPDCGVANIGGAALALASIVRPGPIGLVGASGSGLQEVTCLVERLGSGITQAIGTGGRDLRKEVGGLTMLAGIDLPAAAPITVLRAERAAKARWKAAS